METGCHGFHIVLCGRGSCRNEIGGFILDLKFSRIKPINGRFHLCRETVKIDRGGKYQHISRNHFLDDFFKIVPINVNAFVFPAVPTMITAKAWVNVFPCQCDFLTGMSGLDSSL